MIEAKETLTGNITSSSTLNGSLNKAIEYIAPTTQEKTITPKKEQQIVVPDNGVFALSKVTVEEIPNNYVEVAGTLDITTNGEYDVKSYEKANVNVGGVEINDARYLFNFGARSDNADAIASLISPNCTDFSYCFNRYPTDGKFPQMNTSNGTNFSHFFEAYLGKEIPLYDTSNGTNFSYMFSYIQATTIPLFDLSKATNVSFMFSNALMKTLPLLNTSNVTNFSHMFQNSYLEVSPQFDTSNGTTCERMYFNCSKLTTVPLLDFGKCTSIGDLFYITPKLTTLGGFKDLGKAYLTTQSAGYSKYNLYLLKCPLLTYESLMNVINNLYDIASLGVQPQNLRLHADSMALLSENDIVIATNKGWNVVTT